MIVIDASVAVKWFVKEPLSAEARALVDGDDVRIAPEHVLVEVGQALLRSTRAGTIERGHAEEALLLLDRLVQLLPTRSLAHAALEIALDVGCTNYDALYVAAAERWDATLVTADDRLLQQMRAAGRRTSTRRLGT